MISITLNNLNGDVMTKLNPGLELIRCQIFALLETSERVLINILQPSVGFHIETSHLFCSAVICFALPVICF